MEIKKNIAEIIKIIEQSELNEKDYAAIIRKLYLELDESFDEKNPSGAVFFKRKKPNVYQATVLGLLLTVADKVEEFFK